MKVGDKVICIKTHKQGYCIKHEEYIITGSYKGCCSRQVTIGDANQRYNSKCSKCGKKTFVYGETRISMFLFRKVEPTKRKSNATTRALVKEIVIGDGIEKIRKIEIA